MSERSCGKCRYIRIDGLYDIWCSIRGKDKYYYAKNCPNYKSDEK